MGKEAPTMQSPQRLWHKHHILSQMQVNRSGTPPHKLQRESVARTYAGGIYEGYFGQDSDGVGCSFGVSRVLSENPRRTASAQALLARKWKLAQIRSKRIVTIVV